MHRFPLRAPSDSVDLTTRSHGTGTIQEPDLPPPKDVPTMRIYSRGVIRTSTLKASIVETLRHTRYPMNLCEIVDCVRKSHSFKSGSSVDELIYNTLFELCSTNVVVKVIGTAANEIRYHLADQKCGVAIDLTFQGALSHEQKPNLQNQQSPKSRSRRRRYGDPDGKYFIPVTDSMIHDSFGARAGLKTTVEGLQRPNTPVDPALLDQPSSKGSGDKILPSVQGYDENAGNDMQLFTPMALTTEDIENDACWKHEMPTEITYRRSFPNIPSCVSNASSTLSLHPDTKLTSQYKQDTPEEGENKQDKTIRHIKFLKEIAEILNSHDILQKNRLS